MSFGSLTERGGTGRDLRLDLLRAACVLVMIFDHLSWHELVIHVRFGFVTIAECFFFISGATLGVVAKRRLEKVSALEFDRRLVRRGVWLYGANLAAVALAHLLEGSRSFPGNYFDRYWGATTTLERWLSFDQPSVLNVLPRYAAFLVATPLVLALLRREKWKWAAAGALALWAANFASSGALRLPLFESSRAPYPAASWQLVFFGGLISSWLLHRRNEPPPRASTGRRMVVVGAVLILAAAIAAQRGLVPWPAEMARWTGRALYGPIRLVNFAAVAVLAWQLASRWTPALTALAGRAFLPFGQFALPAFLLHIPWVWALLAMPAIDTRPDLRKLAALLILASLWPLLRWPLIQRWLRP